MPPAQGRGSGMNRNTGAPTHSRPATNAAPANGRSPRPR